MGDMFPDRLESALKTIKNDDEIVKRVDVKQDMKFIGWDAYKQVLASGVDVVLLTTPPAFRPMHLKAAIEAQNTRARVPAATASAFHFKGSAQCLSPKKLRFCRNNLSNMRRWFSALI